MQLRKTFALLLAALLIPASAGRGGALAELSAGSETAEETQSTGALADFLVDEVDTFTAYPLHTGSVSGLSSKNTVTDWINTRNGKYRYCVIPVNPTDELTITANVVRYTDSQDNEQTEPVYYTGVTEYAEPEEDHDAVSVSSSYGWTERRQVAPGETMTLIIPEDVHYIILQVMSRGLPTSPVHRVTVRRHQITWLALGDSITQGYYSMSGDGDDGADYRLDRAASYTAWAAAISGYRLVNEATGGIGWVQQGTDLYPKPNIVELLAGKSVPAMKTVTWTDQDGNERTGYETDDSKPATWYPAIDFTGVDLCTVMLGVNDWKGMQRLGTMSDMYYEGQPAEEQSVYGNMKYFVEQALRANPAMKLILLTPLNSTHSSMESTAESTEADNYGIGYSRFDYTLDDLAEAIEDVAGYYGIEWIDLLHSGIINRVNAKAMLPDGVHPSLTCHRLIGEELAGKLLFR